MSYDEFDNTIEAWKEEGVSEEARSEGNQEQTAVQQLDNSVGMVPNPAGEDPDVGQKFDTVVESFHQEFDSVIRAAFTDAMNRVAQIESKAEAEAEALLGQAHDERDQLEVEVANLRQERDQLAQILSQTLLSLDHGLQALTSTLGQANAEMRQHIQILKEAGVQLESLKPTAAEVSPEPEEEVVVEERGVPEEEVVKEHWLLEEEAITEYRVTEEEPAEAYRRHEPEEEVVAEHWLPRQEMVTEYRVTEEEPAEAYRRHEPEEEVAAELRAPVPEEEVAAGLRVPVPEEEVAAELRAPALQEEVAAGLRVPVSEEEVAAELRAPALQEEVITELRVPVHEEEVATELKVTEQEVAEEYRLPEDLPISETRVRIIGLRQIAWLHRIEGTLAADPAVEDVRTIKYSEGVLVLSVRHRPTSLVEILKAIPGLSVQDVRDVGEWIKVYLGDAP